MGVDSSSTMAMSLVKITRAAAPVVPRLPGLVIRGKSTTQTDPDLFPGAYSHKDHVGTPYTKQTRNTSRPTSPHVTIYAWPPAAISSITNRVCGVSCSVGMLGMSAVAMAGGDVGLMMEGIGQSALAPPAKFAVAFPFIYHYTLGIRHVLWDRKPDMLTNEDTTKTSYGLIGFNVAAAGILALC